MSIVSPLSSSPLRDEKRGSPEVCGPEEDKKSLLGQAAHHHMFFYMILIIIIINLAINLPI